MTEAVAKLVPTKPDAEIAEDIKARALEAVKPLLAISQEAKNAGLELSIAWAPGPLGDFCVTHLRITKVY